MIIMRFDFAEPERHTVEQTRRTAQGDTIAWTIPHAKIPLLLNDREVGYAEVHMHAAWAPDGVPDTSFGFTGRINTEELRAALSAEPQQEPPGPPAGPSEDKVREEISKLRKSGQ